MIAGTLALAFVVLPAMPALAAVCPASVSCPLMALSAEAGPPCGGEVSGGDMDCCAGRESGEPADTEAAVTPDPPVIGQIAAPTVAATSTIPARPTRAAALHPAADGPTLFLLHAVFRL